VKHVVEMHKGSIQVKNNSPKGSIFEVSIPVGA
jgi:signal transduction histidine kinase